MRDRRITLEVSEEGLAMLTRPRGARVHAVRLVEHAPDVYRLAALVRKETEEWEESVAAGLSERGTDDDWPEGRP